MEPGKFEQKLENAISAYLDLCERNASEDEIRKNLAQSLHASYWREKIYLPADRKFEQKLENAISAYLDLCERNASEDEIRKNLAQSLHASYWREKIYLP